MFHIVALLTESVDWNHIYTLSTLKRLCRSPHGERGLKYRLHRNLHQSNQSLSSRRAWIEMIIILESISPFKVALLTESVDWNRMVGWGYLYSFAVALREESVDWNMGRQRSRKVHLSSLSSRRAWIEINLDDYTTDGTYVALLTESVDWNSDCVCHCKLPHLSLSSRRAWIEIDTLKSKKPICSVALLTESVDWNKQYLE